MKDLPNEPAPRNVTMGYVDFGTTLTPALGGSETRVNRLGNRFRVQVTMPPMSTEDARIWVARLVRGRSEGVRMLLPLGVGIPPISFSEILAPKISGSGQTGRVINMFDFEPGYTVKEGQFFSIFNDEQHSVYMADEDATANGLGFMTLTINPLLRKSYPNGTRCLFRKPHIEGLVEGDDWNWDLALDGTVPLSFTIKERA